MNLTEKKRLQKLAVEARMDILEMVYAAQSGHPGGSLSATELLVYLYFKQMSIDPKNPKWEQRDRLVLSKGHVTPILYSCLAMKGYFPKSELKNFRKYGSILQGHPDMKNTPGVDMSTGSLGQGLSCAVGMAYIGQKEETKFNVYAVVGDGEVQEGQIWEALMFAGNHKLNNFKLRYVWVLGILTFLVSLILIYCINALIGFEIDNFSYFAVKIVLPTILTFNFVIAPPIYAAIINSKRFYD